MHDDTYTNIQGAFCPNAVDTIDDQINLLSIWNPIKRQVVRIQASDAVDLVTSPNPH